MRIAIVGCGYVADLYLGTLHRHPQLELAGVFDRDRDRLTRFADHHGRRRYASLDALLADPAVDLVLNLTSPASHAAVSAAALGAGKHVYSEKPLALDLAAARHLVEAAEAGGLQIAVAPCSLLGSTAQTLARALREGIVGPVRLVYAELDDGMIHRMPYQKWRSASGQAWPYRSEFAVGCVLEHASYYLSWLPALFGPAESLTAFAACLVPDKVPGRPETGPDFAVACIRFASGVVARLTCSILAPRNHGLRVIGDSGVLTVDEGWDHWAPVYLRRPLTLGARTFFPPWRRRRCRPVPVPRTARRFQGAQRMDFCLGLAAFGRALSARRTFRLGGRYALHVTELALAIHGAGEQARAYHVTTTLDDAGPWSGQTWAEVAPLPVGSAG